MSNVDRTKDRKNYLDNIRTIIIGLFLAHSCEMYHLKEGFYIEGIKALVPTLIYSFLTGWYMAVLFFIAGLTTMYSLKKRTIKEYYIERCKRLLVPFFIGLFLWVPIQSYYTLRNHYDFDGNALDVYKHFFTTYMLIPMHDMNVWSIDYAWRRLVWAISCTTAVFGTIGFGQRFLNKTNALTKYLSSRSFAIYYIHMTVVIAVGYYVVEYVNCNIALQIGMIMGISVVVTFALIEIAKRIPGVNGMLGMKR
ncbi:MAG: acyltransferase [Lachnospiraceae bacterium]|nr:acyltransferase [Lachnospiraceae bacterium]